MYEILSAIEKLQYIPLHKLTTKIELIQNDHGSELGIALWLLNNYRNRVKGGCLSWQTLSTTESCHNTCTKTHEITGCDITSKYTWKRTHHSTSCCNVYCILTSCSEAVRQSQVCRLGYPVRSLFIQPTLTEAASIAENLVFRQTKGRKAKE